jgi:hypothetical protein
MAVIGLIFTDVASAISSHKPWFSANIWYDCHMGRYSSDPGKYHRTAFSPNQAHLNRPLQIVRDVYVFLCCHMDMLRIRPTVSWGRSKHCMRFDLYHLIILIHRVDMSGQSGSYYSYRIFSNVNFICSTDFDNYSIGLSQTYSTFHVRRYNNYICLWYKAELLSHCKAID